MLTLVGLVQGMLSFFNSGGEGLTEDVMKTKKYQVRMYVRNVVCKVALWKLASVKRLHHLTIDC